MTISEYMRAKTASDGRVIILVSEHKTGAQGPAQIALESAHYKLFAKRFTPRGLPVLIFSILS